MNCNPLSRSIFQLLPNTTSTHKKNTVQKKNKEMNSFEEENLYDFLQDPKPTVTKPLTQNPFRYRHHSATYYILQEVVESGGNAEIEAVGSLVNKYVSKKVFDDGESRKKKKWLLKCLRKDGYDASLCHTCWPTTLEYLGGEYEYIEVLCKTRRGGGQLRVIVDVDFKSQFEVARPTSSYKKLCDVLPEMFVGDEQKLEKIVSILCGEADVSFREKGLHVPPWRAHCYMHSKWFATTFRGTLPPAAPEREAGLVVSSEMIPKRKYLGGAARQCGLSSEFSVMITKCN